MKYYMKVTDGVPTGTLFRKPSTVVLDSEHVVGSEHWGDEDLIEISGIYPVQEFDEDVYVATGGTLEENIIIPVLEEQPATYLETKKTQAKDEIKSLAATARDKFRTPGKDGVYLTKLSEGREWVAAGKPEDLSEYPCITAEIGVTAPTAEDLVVLWETMNTVWTKQALPAIERIEQNALLNIKNSSCVAEINEAKDVIWPKPEDFS